MAEITIKATKIEDIFDGDLLDAIIEDLADATGDADGAYICTGETLGTLIADVCDEDDVKEATKKLKKYMDSLVIVNLEVL